jgi:hypothetical protein
MNDEVNQVKESTFEICTYQVDVYKVLFNIIFWVIQVKIPTKLQKKKNPTKRQPDQTHFSKIVFPQKVALFMAKLTS